MNSIVGMNSNVGVKGFFDSKKEPGFNRFCPKGNWFFKDFFSQVKDFFDPQQSNAAQQSQNLRLRNQVYYIKVTQINEVAY